MNSPSSSFELLERGAPSLAGLFESAARAAATRAPVLVLGEPGTGRRPQGVVDEATTLCLLDDDNPMVIAEYDLPDRG